MARSPGILVNPTWRQLFDTMRDTIQREYDQWCSQAPARMPDPTPLRDEPPAVWLHLLADPRRSTHRAAVFVGRWTDPIGNDLWLIECLYKHSSGPSHSTGRNVGQWIETGRQPLHLLAPMDRYVERQLPDSRARPVLLCRCGAVGTPEQIAWRGSQCGPCFDREQDGDPPLFPFVPPLSQKVLLADEDGWIVEQDGTVESLDPEGRVRWRRPGEGLDAHGGTRDLLLWARHREVCCVETRTGIEVARWVTDEPITQALVREVNQVVTLHDSLVRWWRLGSSAPSSVARIVGSPTGPAIVDPTRGWVLIPTDEAILCFDEQGNELATLVSRGRSMSDSVLVSESWVLAIRQIFPEPHLHVWDISTPSITAERMPRVSFLSGHAGGLLGPIGSPPVVLLRSLFSLEAVDPDTLTPQVSLRFPSRTPPDITPVGPDLVLLHGQEERLLVSWRELLT